MLDCLTDGAPLVQFDFEAMEAFAGADVTKRFKEALVDGSKVRPSLLD